jgi:magnesium transporter
MTLGLFDIYLSTINNRMNETMKILTLFASIFIPLTFIAGIYGMNFKNMPELDWHYGYPLVMGFMASIAGTMLWYFKRKKLI